MNCDTCDEITQYVVGLWDGPNGTHGATYDCHNLDCEIKKAKLKATDYSEENKLTNIIENSKNGISMERVKMHRKELGITIRNMADELGVSCSDYSNYEQCRVALPVEMVDRIEEVFRECMNPFRARRSI